MNRGLHSIVACLLPLIAACQGAEAEAPWQPLFDGRENPIANAPRLFGAARQEVLSAAGITPEEQVMISGLATGAFSAAGRSERAYSVQKTAEHPDATRTIVVILPETGNRVLAVAAFDGAQAVIAAYDIDADGREELLLRADDDADGKARTRLSLARLESGTLDIMQHFDPVIDNGCGAGADGQVRARRIEFRAGPVPEFRHWAYTAACGSLEPPPPGHYKPLTFQPPAA